MKGSGVRNTVIIVVMTMVILVSGFFWKINQPRALRTHEMAANGLVLFDAPREILPFELQAHTGEPFTLDDLKGKWTMVFPGFTNCPDICPTTLATLSTMWGYLDEKPRSDLQVALFSVDPNRDSAEVLSAYVPYFNEDFIGLTGDLGTVVHLGHQLNIAFTVVDPSTAPEHYNVDHSSSIVLINPQGQYQGFFRAPFDPAILKLTYQSAWVQH